MTLKAMVSIMFIAVIALCMDGGGSYAFDPAHLEQLKATKACQKCDLTNANLSKLDLRGAKLMEAKLNGAKLSGANLTGAQLYFADLTGADINGAKFGGAQLTNAIWVDGRLCDHGSLGQCR
jgi:uncharacterized protein YjbI with pentapeptide repeats